MITYAQMETLKSTLYNDPDLGVVELRYIAHVQTVNLDSCEIMGDGTWCINSDPVTDSLDKKIDSSHWHIYTANLIALKTPPVST